MQIIHSIGADETLIDQGCYYYYRSIGNEQEKMPVVEPWSRHRNSCGDIITRAQRDSRSFGNLILVQSTERNNITHRFDVVMRKFVADKIVEVAATYQFIDGGVKVKRTAVDGSVTERIHTLQADCIPSPLMRIYNGAVIQRLIEQGQSQVLVPWIREPDNLQRLLEPLTSQRQARFQAKEKINRDGRQRLARRYEYSGGEYQPGTLFWLDENNVLLRYIWQQDDNTCWDTRLEQYSLA